MTRKKAFSLTVIGTLIAILLVGAFTYLAPVQSVKPAAGEPVDLEGIIEYPDPVVFSDLEGTEKDTELGRIMGGSEGFSEISSFLQAKGYQFDNASAGISRISGVFGGGSFLSWWSGMGSNGTRALIVSALMDDGTSMTMSAVTNLLPPEQVPGIDPYIIVNAMPYLYITWHYWTWAPVAKIHTWHYWWYDSHSHPNWFWGVYWWWRTDVDFYWIAPGLGTYLPWWWFFWHWTYWRHWYWWSTFFPYKRTP